VQFPKSFVYICPMIFRIYVKSKWVHHNSLLLLFSLVSLHLIGQVSPDSTQVVPDSLRNQDYRVPVFNQMDDDSDDLGSQDIAGLLQSSRDVFTSTAGFAFGPARFRIRGLDAENTSVLINGIRMNDLETGRASWAGWGGLNDVTRFNVAQTGVAPSREIFTGIGGFTSISSRASQFKKATRISYASANRTYRNRIMFSHSTGRTKKDWWFTVSGSRRWAQEGYVDGTFFDAWSYFLGAEKKINEKHSLAFSLIGASQQQGLQALVVQEAYDLAGSNYYNPNWGYQAGEKRNSRVRNNHKPTFMVSHIAKMNPSFSMKTTAYVNGGRGGTTRLNWYESLDPRPEYYRYLPSYFDPESDAYFASVNSWQNDVNHRQVKWDDMYAANRKNLYTVMDANGLSGNNVTGNRSKYIVEEMRNDHIQYGFNSMFEKKFSDKTFLSYGLTANSYTSRNYRTVVDLLGGDFWVDVDQFSERDFDDPAVAQNDVTTPNKLIKEGDAYGYDYNNHVRNAEAFTQFEHDFGKVSFYTSGTLALTSMWREGNLQNGRFLNNSIGNSDKLNFLTGGIKAGVTYKINGRHYITANGAWMTRAPELRNVFVSPRTRNDIVNNIQSEEVLTGDLNYVIRHPLFKMRFTGYYTTVNNQAWMRSFYHDEFRNFVNYAMTGVNNLFTGIEFGGEVKVSQTLLATVVLAHGQSLYTSRPLATISRDNNSELIDEERVVYWKNYRVGGMPQTAASIGLKYTSPKFWFVGVNANFFDHIYLDPNPDRRTAEAVEGYVTTDPQWNEILDQTRLDAGFTIDAFAGKSYRIKKNGHFVNFNVSASNILNNRDFRVGGFEQLRYVPSNIQRFPPQFSYMFGFTFFAMISYSF
jgi:hypothetical protein